MCMCVCVCVCVCQLYLLHIHIGVPQQQSSGWPRHFVSKFLVTGDVEFLVLTMGDIDLCHLFFGLQVDRCSNGILENYDMYVCTI